MGSIVCASCLTGEFGMSAALSDRTHNRGADHTHLSAVQFTTYEQLKKVSDHSCQLSLAVQR